MELRRQVCDNLLSLVPGGTCQVLGLYPGSVLLAARITYPGAQSVTKLVNILNEGSVGTQASLIKGLPAGTTVRVAAVRGTTTPSSPMPTLGPSGVKALPSNECQAQLQVNWGVPSGETAPVVFYVVSCLQDASAGTSIVVPASVTQATLNVDPTTAYVCSVTALSFQGISEQEFNGFPVTYTCVYFFSSSHKHILSIT